MKEEGACWDAVLHPPHALRAANIFAAHSVEVSEWHSKENLVSGPRINMFRACSPAVPVKCQILDEQPLRLHLLRSFGDVGIDVAKGIPTCLGDSSRSPSLEKVGPGCHLWLDYCSPRGEGPQMARSVASASSME